MEDWEGLFDTATLQINVVGVQAHWKLDDASGTTTTDSSGNAHNGTLESGGVWSAGHIGSALGIDGIDDRVVVTGYKGVTGTLSRTVAAWIKTTDTNTAIITWGTNAAVQKFTFYVQGAGRLRLEVNGGNIVGNTAVNDGTWHHVALVLFDDGSPNVNEVRFFVDGVYDGSSGSAGEAINTDSGRDVWIGDGFASGRNFTREMDDVRIYDIAF